MKKIIFFEIIRKLRSDPALMRKAKRFAIAGVIGTVLIGGLTVWVSISAVKYLASSANQIIKNDFQKIEFQPLECWSKAQSLMTVQSWVERPALDNFRNLKIACLNPQPSNCQGESCEHIEEIINTTEGRTI